MTTTYSNLVTVPVSPNLLWGVTGNPVVASLAGLAPTTQIGVDWPAPKLPSNADVTLVSTFVDASVALDVGFDGVVEFGGEATGTYVIGDIRYTTERAGNKGSIISKEIWGVSYRFALKAWNLKSANISLPSIAADCTINGSSSACQATVIGIESRALLQSVPGLMMIMGSFDMDEYQQLGTIQSRLTEYIDEHFDELRPHLLAVEIDLAQVSKPYKNSPSTLLGLSGIQNGRTESSTWSKKPSSSQLPTGMTTNETIVKQMYTALGVKDTPTSTQKSQAAQSTFRNEG